MFLFYVKKWKFNIIKSSVQQKLLDEVEVQYIFCTIIFDLSEFNIWGA